MEDQLQSLSGHGPQHQLLTMLLTAEPDEFEALMAGYFPQELDAELEDLEITASHGGILREAAATEAAAQRLLRTSVETAAKAEHVHTLAEQKVGARCLLTVHRG